jgi:hypothetical protein
MIIQNAIRIKSTGQFLVSRNRHDFQSISLAGEVILAVDGGMDYFRRVGDPKLYEEFSLTSEDHFNRIKARLLWGTYGRRGDKPLTWVLLRKCSTLHLKSILRDYSNLKAIAGLDEYRERVIRAILKDRKGTMK